MNIELGRRVAQRLRSLEDERLYDQEWYAQLTECGTACCIAGWTVSLAGLTLVPVGSCEDSFSSVLVNGHKRAIDVVAEELLGIKWTEGWLFSSTPDEDWPEPYRTRWENHEESGERPSRIAADYLDWLCDEAEKASVQS